MWHPFSTFDKNQDDNVLKHLFEITEHVYDAGAESYNWKNFIISSLGCCFFVTPLDQRIYYVELPAATA